MREIKFRAWEKPIFNHPGHMFEVDEIWWSKNRLKENNSAETVYSLVDCVLMQYTGLKDKNGKEIYEGDILLKSYEKDNKRINVTTYKVFFNAGCFMVVTDDGRRHLLGDEITLLEVIGNIYENPELTGGK